MAAVRTIMVVGAGRMGSGIAQTAAQAGINVVLTDRDMTILDNSMASMRNALLKRVEKGHMQSDEVSAIVEKICLTRDLADCRNVDFVIEAVSEELSIKQELFKELAGLTGDHVVLATNTSSLSITELGAAVDCPGRIIGMHFMNPVPKMQLVEVIKGLNTDAAACDQTVELAEALGKEPIVVNDYPGFVSNRLLMPMINEAVYCIYEGVADVKSVDRVMQLGMNHPMGPLALADLIGLDICLAIMQILQRGFGDDKYRPCPLLVNMVKAGQLGKKTGKGFYPYQ